MKWGGLLLISTETDTKSITVQSSSQVPSSGASVFHCSASEGICCRIRRKYLGAGVRDYRGELCTGCLWAEFSPLLVPNSCQSAEYFRHKRGRFFIRAFRGVDCGLARGSRFRWFVLTESDSAISSGIDFGSEFHRFITWLRYSCPDFQYLVVEHRQGDKERRNWHVLSYGSDRLPVLKIRDYWQSHYRSTVTGMAEVKDIGKAVRYLAGYLSSREKFVRAWCSQGWVFRGWLSRGRLYRRNYGEYISPSYLVALSLMSPAERSSTLEWLVETGFMTVGECQAVKV